MQRWPRPGILWLGRLVEDPGKSVVTSLWNGTEWEVGESVMRALVGGDAMVDEITEDEARSLRPQAVA